MLKKKSRVNSTNFLAEFGILQHVLKHLGPGHWLSAALVSKAWRQAYLQVPEHHVIGAGPTSPRIPVVCAPQMTLYSAAVASASRLAFVHAAGVDVNGTSLQFAAGKWGETAMLRAAVQRGMTRQAAMVMGALQSRYLSTLQWLLEDDDFLLRLPDEALQIAAFGGCPKILAWLKQRGMTLTADLLQSAACNGRFDVLQYLRSEGLDWCSDVSDTAACFGQLALLQQLREHGCPWDADEIGISAAASGSVPLLVWLQEQGILFTDVALMSAACSGHVAACEYLRFTAHCPWTPNACMMAAESNRLRVLQWLREHGCPCADRVVCTSAAHEGSIDIMAYMLEQLEQQQLDAVGLAALLVAMLAAAGANDQLAAAQWLHAQGAAWPEVLQYTYGEQQQWRGAVLEGCASPVE
jgi:F-box domain